MRNSLLLVVILCGISSVTFAKTDLIEIYHQALMNDPVYQQAISQRLEDQDEVDIARSPLLPQIGLSGAPIYSKQHINGTTVLPEISTRVRSYTYSASISQVIFDCAHFFAYSKAKKKGLVADATFNSASEDLILRVAQAYFNILKDQDNLQYNRANKEALAKQLDRSKQRSKQGLASSTDVYTAESSYAAAEANYYAAETALANDKENLRAITDDVYPQLATLNQNFPIIKPDPLDMEIWVAKAKQQNWEIKAALLENQKSLDNIKQQSAGHLPTVILQGNYTGAYSHSISNSGSGNTSVSGIAPVGNAFASLSLPGGHSNNASISMYVNLPIYAGGGVISETRQAKHNYQVTSQKLTQVTRSIINNTRQSYLSILSEIKQIEADKKSITAAINSLKGLEIGYKSGSRTLIDILTQQQNVLQTQAQYTAHRYAYINNLLTLKKQIGTLSQEDLEAINRWLDA